ncbi:MAG: hypothetical protein EOM37_19120 [Proteobacteria bacterium]|nr:hypothetical protein [Pseudomonadota bacterium]
MNRCLTRGSKFSALHATIQRYEAREGVPAGLKAMAATGRWPHTPQISSIFFKQWLQPSNNHGQQPPTSTSRSVAVMVLRRVGCLTEPGIVW